MITLIGLEKDDALLIKKGLKLLDEHFNVMGSVYNKDYHEEKRAIEKIIFEINVKFNL